MVEDDVNVGDPFGCFLCGEIYAEEACVDEPPKNDLGFIWGSFSVQFLNADGVVAWEWILRMSGSEDSVYREGCGM